MKNKFTNIKSLYDKFHCDMLSQGRLMVKDTNIGYWGIAPTEELFELFQKTGLSKHKKFIDLGSGDGRAAIIADLFTDATGVEFDSELHDFASSFAKKLKSGAKLMKGNFMVHKLSAYDYIFINPDKTIFGDLEDKLQMEMKPGAKLVVFGLHKEPKSMKRVDTLDVNGSLVGVYRK